MSGPLHPPSWFDSPAKIVALRAVAEEWIGTPFFANSEACGRDGGVDCVRLLHAIYRALGIIPKMEIGKHAVDYGQHASRSLLIATIETVPALRARFACLPANEAEPVAGDLLCFNSGGVPHHGGLMLDRGEFIHALRPEGVYIMQLRAAIRGQRVLGALAAIYRPRPDPQ